jgi:hypothetical protein
MPAISAFPACCGASILTGFNNDPLAPAGFKTDPKTFTYELDGDGKRIPITFKDRFLEELKKYRENYKGFMYSAILTEAQLAVSKGAWKALLKECGFDCVRRWTNSVHNDTGFLYLFVLCTDGKGKCKGDFTQPPKGWDELPGPVREEPKPPTFQKLAGAVTSKAA